MNIVVVNGSPRKIGNTAKMLNSIIEGAKSVNEEVNIEYVNLSSLNFTGCKSCFGCKIKGGKTYGHCIVKDDLHDIIERVHDADALVIGSPIYFGDMNSNTRQFIERIMFPKFTYEEGYRSIAPKRMPIVMVYTMNVKEQEQYKNFYDAHLLYHENFIGRTFSQPERICAFNTYQFKDYNRYVVETFSEPEKRVWREEQFPKDLQTAYNKGRQLVEAYFSTKA